MAHGLNACHLPETNCDSNTMRDSEGNLEHHIEQLLEESSLSSLMVSKKIPSSDCLSSEAGSPKDSCPDPQCNEGAKLVESEKNIPKDIPNQLEVTKREVLDMFSNGTEQIPGLLADLEGYSDVSSCSETDFDPISNASVVENHDQSVEHLKISTKGKNEINDSSNVSHAIDSHCPLAASDKEIMEMRDSDNSEPHESTKNESGHVNNAVDDGNQQEKSLLNLQNQSLNAIERDNGCTLGKDERMEKIACLKENSERSVEDMNCKDSPVTPISSECTLSSNIMTEDEKNNGITGEDELAERGCHLEGDSKPCESKFLGSKNESKPDQEIDGSAQSVLDDGSAQAVPDYGSAQSALENGSVKSHRPENKCSSVDQDIERSSFEFLQSCFGFKNTELSPPSLSSLALTRLDQNETQLMHESQTSSCDTSTQPPVLVKTAFEPVSGGQMDEAVNGMPEPPLLSKYCRSSESSESTHQNYCTEGQKNTGLGVESWNQKEMVSSSSQELMNKLQPVVLLKTTAQKANDGSVYHCSECKKDSESLDKLIEHHYCTHSPCKFQCCVTCSRYFSSDSLAEQHVCGQYEPSYAHDSLSCPKKQTEKRHMCRYCLKTFSKKSYYREHERKHETVTEHRCECCGMYFLDANRLKTHKRKVQCPPLIHEPQNLAKENSKMKLMEVVNPMLVIDNDGVEMKLYDCFVKLVDVNKDRLPQKMKCPVCTMTFRLRAQLRTHLRSHSEEKPFKCDTCTKAFKYSWNLNKHKREQCSQNTIQLQKSPKSESKGLGRFQCPLCPRAFKYLYNRSRHMREQCMNDYTLNGKGKTLNGYKCPLCRETFTKACNRNRHLKKTCFLRYKAKGTVIKRREARSDLNKSAHDKQGPQTKGSSELASSQTLTCRFCEKCFNSTSALAKHVRYHVGNKPFRCLDCGKSFTRHSYLLTHKNVHKRRIQCSVCKKILPTIGDLLKHRQSHINKGTLKCPDCPMQFKFPAYLLRHMTTHEKRHVPTHEKKAKPKVKNQNKFCEHFKCGVCHQRFEDSKALSKHCLTHMPKPFVLKCQFCKRNFQSRAILIRHIRLHTGEKPYPCPKCGECFSRKEYVKIHDPKCIVPDDKYKKCPYCPRMFTKLGRLKFHERAHVAESLFPCSKCGKCYKKKNLNDHQKICRSTESQPTDSKKKMNNTLEEKGTDSAIANTTCKESKMQKSIKDKLKERCPHCSKRFQFRCYLLRHIRSHSKKKPFACKHCGQKYDGQKQCLQHEASCDQVFREHSGAVSVNASNLSLEQDEFKCSFCTKTFTKARNLRYHILSHTDVKPYRCKVCESSFSRYDHLKLHQVHCKGKRQRLEVRIEKINVDLYGAGLQSKTQEQSVFECNVCFKQFPGKVNLTRHFSLLHSTVKPFTCKRCGNCFSSKKTLRRHTLIVNCKKASKENLKKPVPASTNGPVQPCRETSRILQRIEGQYSDKFKFPCEYCPRRFQNQSQLKIHTRLHTGEKPFGCAKCGEHFIRRDYLQRHLLKCSGKREIHDKVPCNRCGGSFTTDVLHRHQRSCTAHFKSQEISQATSTSDSSRAKGFSCASCSEHFLLFSQLQQHILTEHRSDKLQQTLSDPFNIKEEPVDEGYVESLPGSKQMYGGKEKPYECPKCKLRFINSSGLQMHMRTHTASYPHSCKRCSKGFWNKTLLQKHARKCSRRGIAPKKEASLDAIASELDPNETVLLFNKGSKTTGTGVLQTKFSCKDQDKEDPVVHKYQCSECDQSFTDGLRLISHLEAHGREDLERRLGKKHKCHLCGKAFDQAGVLQRHIKAQHQEALSNTCPECSRTFRCASELDIHRSCHDRNRPFVCNTCKLRFWTSKAMRIHEKLAHQPCQEKPAKTEPAKKNESSAEGPKVFTCQPCDKSYTLKASYMKHLRLKHRFRENSKSRDPSSENVAENESDGNADADKDGSDDDSDSAPYFPCHVCGKTFVTSESLEDHQRCHLGEKPFECEECGKCFFQLGNLQQHQRSHKTEFQCNLCGKGFVSVFALRKHKHTHVTKRQHRCTKCHLSFTGSSQLTEHMLTHRDENFPCDLCDKTFSCKSSRAEHRKTHAEQEEELPPLIPPTKQVSPPKMSNSNSPNISQHYKYRCGVCQVRFQDPEQLSEHGCSNAKERPYSCSECNKHFLHGSHLKKHQLSHQLSGPHVFNCSSCDMSFNQRHQYLSHVRRHGEEPFVSQVQRTVTPETSDLDQDKIYKCPICPERFAQALELASHLSVHSHKCNVCNKTFPTKQQLEEHEQCHLPAATQYECTECGDSFLGSDSFRQHNCARQKRLYSDQHLGHSSKSPPRKKRSLGSSSFNVVNEEEEEEVDVGEDFYNCPTCNKRFSSSSSLQEHQKLHDDGRPFKCLVCQKGFTKKKYLTQHQQLHSERPYQCEFCDESFKTESSLLSHQKTHDASRTHQCPVCSKSYRTPSELSKHKRKHPELQGKMEGNGEHRCEMCYKSFSNISQLRKHEKTHDGQIVYECTECDRAFAFLNLLVEHQQTHAMSIGLPQHQPPSHMLFENPVDEQGIV